MSFAPRLGTTQRLINVIAKLKPPGLLVTFGHPPASAEPKAMSGAAKVTPPAGYHRLYNSLIEWGITEGYAIKRTRPG